MPRRRRQRKTARRTEKFAGSFGAASVNFPLHMPRGRTVRRRPPLPTSTRPTHTGKRLLEIGNDVGDMLETDANPNTVQLVG
jgi:hypothetical protein